LFLPSLQDRRKLSVNRIQTDPLTGEEAENLFSNDWAGASPAPRWYTRSIGTRNRFNRERNVVFGKISVKTKTRTEFVDVTRQVESWLAGQDCREGQLVLFVPHTTAGITVNENADPDVRKDLLSGLATVFPERGGWRHAEGNSDAHLKSSALGVSLTLIVRQGRLCLGRWQSIYLFEGDGARSRRLLLSFVGTGGDV